MQKDQKNIQQNQEEASVTALQLAKANPSIMIEFTAEELRKSKIHVIGHSIAVDLINDKEWPTDVHLVSMRVGNKIIVDAVRAYTMVDIFDEYYHKVKELGGEITSIKNGYGRIKPKLYGKIGSQPSN